MDRKYGAIQLFSPLRRVSDHSFESNVVQVAAENSFAREIARPLVFLWIIEEIFLAI